MSLKPSIPRGTRDFGPSEMKKRAFLLEALRRAFTLYGFEAVETPAMEQVETLTGKYGEEGDQLIYRILNSRLNESKDHEALLRDFTKALDEGVTSTAIAERALRYDLTVPFARFVAMNRHQLTFPFRRYQVQPVWRADRPQKGRYREFYQCDADIIGTPSLLSEVELLSLMDRAFASLRLPAVIKINNRKILNGFTEVIGEKERFAVIVNALDKLDKIGFDGVQQALELNGVPAAAIGKVKQFVSIAGGVTETLASLAGLLSSSETGMKGVEELEFVTRRAVVSHVKIEISPSLARGLDYYTGAIFEAVAGAGSLRSSILGGGRYDDLTSIFGLSGVSGVGISFGVDRIYDVMEELKLFPPEISNTATSRVLFVHFDAGCRDHSISLSETLRSSGISCEVYPDLAKPAKQLDYCNKRHIPFACFVGSNEMQTGIYQVKNMTTGDQQKLSADEFTRFFAT